MQYKKLQQLVGKLNQEITKQKVNGEETKISQKLLKIGSKLQVYFDEFNEIIEGYRIDNASIDDKGVLLKDEQGNYKFSKEGLKNLLKQTKELSEKEFIYEKINVVNPAGLEEFTFLQDWVSGVEFIKEEEL